MFHFYLKILHPSPWVYTYAEHFNVHIIFTRIQLQFGLTYF